MASWRVICQSKPHSAHTGLSGCHLMTGRYLIRPPDAFGQRAGTTWKTGGFTGHHCSSYSTVPEQGGCDGVDRGSCAHPAYIPRRAAGEHLIRSCLGGHPDRSDQSVTSDALLRAVHGWPESQNVVRPDGSQHGLPVSERLAGGFAWCSSARACVGYAVTTIRVSGGLSPVARADGSADHPRRFSGTLVDAGLAGGRLVCAVLAPAMSLVRGLVADCLTVVTSIRSLHRLCKILFTGFVN